MIGFKLFTDILVQGWASITVAIFFVGGIQLLVLGVMGEYIARMYEDVRARPLYVVRERKGFASENEKAN